MYDVIVVGAGTSGMMAAISAAEHGAKVLLIEKNKRVGKKLLLTGGGRCNVTNAHAPEDVIAHIPGNGKFLYSAFSQFNNEDIRKFFESRGVQLKEEDHGRLFPVTDRSRTIVEALHEALVDNDVKLLTNAPIKKLLIEDGRIQGVHLENGERFVAPCVIIATGGMTYQYTGSTGIGYRLAKKAGHTVTPLYPTESPIKLNNPFVAKKTLQGLSLQDVALSVLNTKGKAQVTHRMDMLLTHFGISGPAALRCSMFVNQGLEKHGAPVQLRLDALPDRSKHDLVAWIQSKQQEVGGKTLRNGLKGLVPERLLQFAIDETQTNDQTPMKQLQPKEIDRLVTFLKEMPLNAVGTYPLDKSFVTGGGVSLKEIEPRSFQSKKVDGLFFVGELLDINGYTGGYNITSAFVTGYVAGKHAAETASYFHY